MKKESTDKFKQILEQLDKVVKPIPPRLQQKNIQLQNQAQQIIKTNDFQQQYLRSQQRLNPELSFQYNAVKAQLHPNLGQPNAYQHQMIGLSESSQDQNFIQNTCPQIAQPQIYCNQVLKGQNELQTSAYSNLNPNTNTFPNFIPSNQEQINPFLKNQQFLLQQSYQQDLNKQILNQQQLVKLQQLHQQELPLQISNKLYNQYVQQQQKITTQNLKDNKIQEESEKHSSLSSASSQAKFCQPASKFISQNPNSDSKYIEQENAQIFNDSKINRHLKQKEDISGEQAGVQNEVKQEQEQFEQVEEQQDSIMDDLGSKESKQKKWREKKLYICELCNIQTDKMISLNNWDAQIFVKFPNGQVRVPLNTFCDYLDRSISQSKNTQIKQRIASQLLRIKDKYPHSNKDQEDQLSINEKFNQDIKEGVQIKDSRYNEDQNQNLSLHDLLNRVKNIQNSQKEIQNKHKKLNLNLKQIFEYQQMAIDSLSTHLQEKCQKSEEIRNDQVWMNDFAKNLGVISGYQKVIEQQILGFESTIQKIPQATSNFKFQIINQVALSPATFDQYEYSIDLKCEKFLALKKMNDTTVDFFRYQQSNLHQDIKLECLISTPNIPYFNFVDQNRLHINQSVFDITNGNYIQQLAEDAEDALSFPDNHLVISYNKNLNIKVYKFTDGQYAKVLDRNHRLTMRENEHSFIQLCCPFLNIKSLPEINFILGIDATSQLYRLEIYQNSRNNYFSRATKLNMHCETLVPLTDEIALTKLKHTFWIYNHLREQVLQKFELPNLRFNTSLRNIYFPGNLNEVYANLECIFGYEIVIDGGDKEDQESDASSSEVEEVCQELKFLSLKSKVPMICQSIYLQPGERVIGRTRLRVDLKGHQQNYKQINLSLNAYGDETQFNESEEVEQLIIQNLQGRLKFLNFKINQITSKS